MSRNRLKNSQSLHWMGVVKWLLIVGLMSVLGLSYMFCKNQNLHAAEETSQLQHQLDTIQERNRQLTLDLAGMKSPRELQRRLVQMHSTLVSIGNLYVVSMDQNTRMSLVRIGTEPTHNINLNPPGTSASLTAPQP